jgi:hypothetical protein
VYRRYLVCGHTVSFIENARRFDCDLRNTCDGRRDRHWPFRRKVAPSSADGCSAEGPRSIALEGEASAILVIQELTRRRTQ